jgi:NAD(P)-dependent dehydrogenase (short-subunit alcohol dehydrogenase family)
MEINGKKVVVIGGASGMGRASAELLADRGADVAVLDREGSDGKAVADGLGGTFYPVDVTDFTGTEETLQTAVDKLGGLHVVVTTAGGGIAKRTMTKSGPHDLESFQSVIDLNLIATFNISRLAAGYMSKNEPEDDERGVIINTASIAAFEGQIGQVAYTAAKAGIAGMCLTMARDLGSLGIRVLAIAPSLFATGLTKGIPDEFASALTKDAAFPKRLGRPEEYAKLVAAIVDNPMLNGQCLRLDAGQRFAPK